MTVPDPSSLLATVDALAPELVAFRRTVHRNPEPSWEEHRTSAAVADRLSAAGLSPRIGDQGTGVVCDIGTSGPLVAMRADLDALRLPDGKDVDYRSEVDGVCHACGHDVHTAGLLGAAVALAEVLGRPGATGRVRCIFQPAEEAIPGGAATLVEAGVMDGVAAVFALHCDPTLEVGTVGVSPGPITSAADRVVVRLKGPGGHTARPHRTADLVHLLAKLAVDLPQVLHRRSDPRDAVNLTFGHIEAGDAGNVIPTEGLLSGSLRAAGRAGWEEAGPRLRTHIAAIVEPHGATWELEHQVGAPPIVNDPWATDVLARAARVAVGPTAVVPTAQSSGGEDFSWYLEHAPGAYARLGVRTPGAPVVDIHAGSFDVDERCIPLAARLLAASALEAAAQLDR